jgi:predicted SnoaL-like aldol condensation-catalyzing enzyme
LTLADQIEDNKALIRRFYEVVWAKSDIAAIDSLFATEFVNHDSGPHSSDREGFKDYVAYARKHADYQPTIVDMIAEGDRVVVRIAGRGRLRRKLLGVTLVDRQIGDKGIVIWRIAGGRIAERWARWG